MKPMRCLLSYLTALMVAAGSSLALLLLSTAVLWATPTTSSIPLGFDPGVVTTDSVNNRIYNTPIQVVEFTNIIPNY